MESPLILNGDGKSNISEEDALESVDLYLDRYTIVVCNPPFGQRINETRREVLRNYDLGHEWEADSDGVMQQTSKLRAKQEAGILFLEACVKQAAKGGRIAIILPNGYLGNRSAKYVSVREWMLRHCRVASICSFPRFTFKQSGADVSASVVYLEKRDVPLSDARSDSSYEVNIELIEKVGWKLGDKVAAPIYRRDPEDGSYILSEVGERQLDADFEALIADIRTSPAVQHFPWLGDGHVPNAADATGWSISVGDVIGEPTLCLDPKRHSRKARELRSSIAAGPSFRLGDAVDFIPELRTSAGRPVKIDPASIYEYVEIQDVQEGDYYSTSMRGWALPQRGRHLAEPRDVFVGSVWGSVGKWFVANDHATNVVVTNGFQRLRLKSGKEDLLLDLVVALGTEAYATQMRAFARGSDGLAEVTITDMSEVLVPRIDDTAARTALKPFVDRLLEGQTRISSKVSELVVEGEIRFPTPPLRPHHTALV